MGKAGPMKVGGREDRGVGRKGSTAICVAYQSALSGVSVRLEKGRRDVLPGDGMARNLSCLWSWWVEPQAQKTATKRGITGDDREESQRMLQTMNQWDLRGNLKTRRGKLTEEWPGRVTSLEKRSLETWNGAPLMGTTF